MVAAPRLWSTGSIVVARGSVAPYHVDPPGPGLNLSLAIGRWTLSR